MVNGGSIAHFWANVTFLVAKVVFFGGRDCIFFTAGQFFDHMTRKSKTVSQPKI